MTIKTTTIGIFNAIDRLTNENKTITLSVAPESKGTFRLFARNTTTLYDAAVFWVDAPASDVPLLDALATIGNQYIKDLDDER